RAIDVGVAPALNDAAAKSPNAWVILPKEGPFRTQPAIKEKVDRFRVENATRDGLDEVKIRNRRQCDLGELKPDMILAEDIEGDEGSILQRKGTMLTENMVVRLRELAVETHSRTFLWIGDLA